MTNSEKKNGNLLDNEAATSNSLTLYCNQMEQIKAKIGNAAQIVNKKIVFENDNFAYEFASVQLRKILELIAFSSLIANKEHYSTIHKNFQYHYSAERILKDIEKINPLFYPKPVKKIEFTESGVHYMEIANNYLEGENTPLTRDEFSFLYDACSKVLHIGNPYQDKIHFVDFKYSIDQWLKKISNLLGTHYIRLVDGSSWLITMKSEENNKAHGFGLTQIYSSHDSAA